MNGRIINRLHDTLDAAERIQRWTTGLDLSAFIRDDLLQSGIERQFEIIGESLRVVRHVRPQIELVFPQIHGWIALRNTIAHEYRTIDYDAIWLACTLEIPLLIETLNLLIDSGGRSGDLPSGEEAT